MSKRTLTINELRKQGPNDPIYVLNETVNLPQQERANIVFTAKADNGDVSTVAVFTTWIPTCLTDLTDRQTILRSQGFLNAVHGGSITIITEEEATRLMSMKGAREEYERVRKMNINSTVGISEEITKSNATQIEVVGNQPAQDSNPISASVLALTESMDNGTGIEGLNSLRNLGGLNDQEYAHVMRHARSLGDGFKDVVDYCREKLNRKTAS